MILLLGCILPAPENRHTGDDTALTTATTDTGLSLEEDDARVRALTDLLEGDAPCAPPLLLRVNYTVDGDTFYAKEDATGQSVKVRMIGVDTPEVSHQGETAECYANESWTFTARELEGRLAWLTYDAECLDDYDRDLGYVIRDSTEAGFFNRRLARNGYADTLTIAPNDTFADLLADDVRAAQEADAGRWGACP